MSTLQLSLAIIGGLVLAFIVAYNTWTSRRNAPKRAVPPDPDHPAEPTVRQEPGFDAAATPVPAGDYHGLDRGPDPLEHTVDVDDALQMPVPAFSLERRPGLDALIDVIAPLQPENVVSGDAALAALPPTRRAGSKPFAVEGLNESTQQWETPAPGQRYQSFQAGVQLANRMGALNEIEFSEFVVKAQAFADAINAAPDFPDMLQEVARARELDQFASDHDAQLAFMLRARQAAWSPGYVQQNAARLGFVHGAMPGRLVLPAGAQGLPPLLTLGYDTQAALAEDPDQSAIREVTLSLDVSQVHRTEQPFTRLREVAAALCEAMDGMLCDQNGTALPAMAMDPIAVDLELLYDQLDGRDLSAGSVLARRLFS
ncbi:MAG: cell division protein FtsZ [Acidovorax sp.]|uniref:cell division protein FtsZ n=1 Tax=Acidovorax sp. TaxID=1872122 RepID=UPI00391AA35C